MHIDYNPIGSGGGIQAITNRTVDFGASDAPLTPDQFNACNGCVQIPWALSHGGLVQPPERAAGPEDHRQGARGHLPREGHEVERPGDHQAEPRDEPPVTSITPIFRSDGSGTSYNFTDYLSKVSPEWKSKVGKGTQVNFPTGVGGRGSSGVSAVLRAPRAGSCTPTSRTRSRTTSSSSRVKNKAGMFQLPGRARSGGDATTEKQIPADNKISIVDPPKSQARLSDLHLQLRHPPAEDATRRRCCGSASSGADQRPKKYGPPLRFVQIPPRCSRARRRRSSASRANAPSGQVPGQSLDTAASEDAPRSASRAAAATSAAAGIVRIQATTMFPATPQRTAESRFVAPAPITAPEMTCVVESG